MKDGEGIKEKENFFLTNMDYYIRIIMTNTAPFWKAEGQHKRGQSPLECITVFMQSIDYDKCGKPMREALIKVNNAVISRSGRS